MKKEQYVLPMIVQIEAKNPNKIMEEIAKAIYDAVNAVVHAEEFDSCLFDIQYSIYQKMHDEDFVK